MNFLAFLLIVPSLNAEDCSSSSGLSVDALLTVNMCIECASTCKTCVTENPIASSSGWSLIDNVCLDCNDVQVGCTVCPDSFDSDLVLNGDFEIPSTGSSTQLGMAAGWLQSLADSSSTFVNYATSSPSNTQHLFSFVEIEQTFAVLAGEQYLLAIWVSFKTLSGFFRIEIDTVTIDLYPTVTSQWVLYKFTIDMVNSSVTLRLSSPSVNVEVDHVQVKRILSSYCSSCAAFYDEVAGSCNCDLSMYSLIDGNCRDCESELYTHAYFLDTYLQVRFEFPLDLLVLSCQGVFRQQSLEKFGDGYYCQFLDNKTLIVNLGEGFTLRNEDLVLESGIFQTDCDTSNLNVSVKYLFEFPKPSAQLLLPSSVNYACEDLNLNAKVSTGRLNHELLYKWSFESLPPNDMLSQFDTDYQPDLDYFTIPREFLSSGEIKVVLSVKNFLESADQISYTIASEEDSEINIMIDKSISNEFLSSKGTIVSIGVLSKCGYDKFLNIETSLHSVTGNSTVIDETELWNVQENPMILYVPGKVFPPLLDIMFKFKVLNSEAFLSLSSVPEAPVILTDFSLSKFNVYEELKIDGSESYDPNTGGNLEYSWECLEIDSNVSCSNHILDAKSSVMQIPSNALQPDKDYKITFSCTAFGTSSSISLSVAGVDYHVPRGYISLYKQRDQPRILSSQEWNRFTLNIDNPEGYEYHWYMKTGSYSFEYERNLTSVTLLSETLVPGEWYTLAVDATSAGVSYTYTYEFYVNIPPVFGDLSVNNNGVEFSDTFEMLASEWIDLDSNDTLHYSFGYTLNNNDYYLNIKNQSYIYYAQFPQQDTLQVWVEVYDSLNDKSRKSDYIQIDKSQAFNAESFINEHEIDLNYYYRKYFDLPYLINDLNARILNSNDGFSYDVLQRAFDLVSYAIDLLIDSIYDLDEQDTNAIISMIVNLTNNPELISEANARKISEKIDILISKNTVSTENLFGYAKILNNCLDPTQDFLYNSTGVIEIVLDTLPVMLTAYAPEMVFNEAINIANNKLEIYIDNEKTDLLNGLQMNVSSGISIDFPLDFSDSLQPYFSTDELFVATSKIIPVVSENAVPYILDLVLYDYVTLDRPQISLNTNFSFVIPVTSSVDEDLTKCVFLNSTWDTTGCYTEGIEGTNVLCKCSHLTSFSAVNIIEAAPESLEKSNISDPYSEENLENTNETNLMGLYLCSILLAVYLTGFVIACKFDRKDMKSEKYCKVAKESVDRSPRDEELQELESDRPHAQSFKKLMTKHHHLISPFIHSTPEMQRKDRLTIFTLSIFGKLYFLGLFYSYDEDTRQDSSIVDAIEDYDIKDFWNLAFSILLLVPITLLLDCMFKSQKKCTRRNGLALSWVIILFFCWNIVGFVISFPEASYYEWIVNVVFTLTFSILFTEPIKIYLANHLGHCASLILYRLRKTAVKVAPLPVNKQALPVLIVNLFNKAREKAFDEFQCLSPPSYRTIYLS